MLQQFDPEQPSNRPSKTSFLERNGYLFKAAIILLLVILMQIPTAMITGLISEREQRQRQASVDVSAKWGLEQVVSGPILTIPYYRLDNEDGKSVKRLAYAHVLPADLNISGELAPEKRYRTFYEIVVYNSKIKVAGQFDLSDFNNMNIPAGDVLWKNAFLNVGISDLRGIEEQIKVKWDKGEYMFNAGIETNDVLQTGVHTIVPIAPVGTQNSYTFEFDLELKGSSLLHFTPVGRETKVKIHSNWTNPSFRGAFLPDTRKITEKDFNAEWKVLHLNRKYPQMWKGNQFAHALGESAFGVNLLLPGDHYAKSDRTVKYSFVLIALTFMVFFFMEVLNQKKVHPFQYILIGLALCIFYSLLLSFAEHFNFDLAYGIAAAMTIALIGMYTIAIFKDKKYAFLVAGILTILYLFVFVVVRLQDYSLLIGSLGLFVALATVMYLSRQIDWYNIKTEENTIK
jgi:inner membrane protein